MALMTLARPELEAHVAAEMERLFESVPFARQFHSGADTHRTYYQRHLTETVLRIRLNNEVDAYSLYRLASSDNVLAQRLAQYLAEEYGHEHMFLKDLERLGVTEADVDATEPFFSTRLLIGYLYHSIHVDGPMPTMVWNWFVEWYSDTYNGTITRKAASAFGAEYVRGAIAHLAVDESREHDDLMFSTVSRVVRAPGDRDKAKRYASHFVTLIAHYFRELYEATLLPTREATELVGVRT